MRTDYEQLHEQNRELIREMWRLLIRHKALREAVQEALNLDDPKPILQSAIQSDTDGYFDSGTMPRSTRMSHFV